MTAREQSQLADVLHEIRRHTGYLERLEERTTTHGSQLKDIFDRLNAATSRSERNTTMIRVMCGIASVLVAGIFGFIILLHWG